VIGVEQKRGGATENYSRQDERRQGHVEVSPVAPSGPRSFSASGFGAAGVTAWIKPPGINKT